MTNAARGASRRTAVVMVVGAATGLLMLIALAICATGNAKEAGISWQPFPPVLRLPQHAPGNRDPDASTGAGKPIAKHATGKPPAGQVPGDGVGCWELVAPGGEKHTPDASSSHNQCTSIGLPCCAESKFVTLQNYAQIVDNSTGGSLSSRRHTMQKFLIAKAPQVLATVGIVLVTAARILVIWL